MSSLPIDVHHSLYQLLQALSSSDNDVRASAEEQLNVGWLASRPEVLLMGLVEQIATSQELPIRSFASVLFRRLASKSIKPAGSETSTDLFLSLQQVYQHVIRAKLLEALQKETKIDVRHKICDAIAEVARQYADDSQNWQELLQTLFTLSQSQDGPQREGAFRIFATTPGIIQTQHEEAVLGALTRGFKDDDVSVRISAMEAFSAFFGQIPKKAQKKYYRLIPEVLNILPPLKDSGDGDNLRKAFASLLELTEDAPSMFKGLFRNLVQFSISVIQDKSLEDDVRQTALELMATFSDCAPNMCKKDPSYAPDMVTQCLSFMTDVGADDDDAAEWNAAEDLDSEESDLNHIVGEQCMDRLANKLGGEVLLQPTFSWLPRMMGSNNWRDRHAALMAISAISEGCRELMQAELDKVLDLVIPALQDNHPRVRWAGCNALGQMSTDFAGIMQEKYHEVILTQIIPVLNAPEPRIQAHAAAALVNFSEEAEKAVLEPYLDSLLNHLLRLLQNQKRYVQEQALSTIATIADSAETAFGKYYDTLMPLLFNVLRTEQAKEYQLLKAKAMECAALIALAVGKERMGQDALELVQIMGEIQAKITEADDPQSQYLLQCWGRMCRVLEQDFVPYLHAVMQPLLEIASAKADVQILDDEEQADNINGQDGWELVPIKGKVIGIKTSALEDKNMAIELISIYARQLEAAFEPYVVEIMSKVSLSSLAFFFHDPVRIAAAKSVPILLNSYKKAHGERSPEMAKLWELTIDKVLECLEAEPSIATLAEMYQCFYESVEVLGKKCLTSAHMEMFIQSAKSTLEDYQKRVQNRAEDFHDVGDDEEEDEERAYAIEDDQTLLSDMNKAFHTIFKNQESTFLPSWSRLMPFYDAFITSADATHRQWALCIMDDVLEYCGDQSWNFQDHIRQPLITGMQDEAAANRQAACYGVGIAALKGGSYWGEFCIESLPLLFQVTQFPKAREEDDVFATENACAGIAKILQTHHDKIPNAQEVVSHWINTLPIVNDEEAAPFAYLFLSKLIDEKSPAVTTASLHCFDSIASALDAEVLQGATAQKVVQSARLLLQFSGTDAQKAVEAYSPEKQQRLQSLFTPRT